jgi:hypothetical protein
MILVCELVDGFAYFFGDFGNDNTHCRAEHLDCLEQDFIDVLVHHFFGGSSRVK